MIEVERVSQLPFLPQLATISAERFLGECVSLISWEHYSDLGTVWPVRECRLHKVDLLKQLYCPNDSIIL